MSVERFSTECRVLQQMVEQTAEVIAQCMLFRHRANLDFVEFLLKAGANPIA